MDRSESIKFFASPRNLGRRKYDQARWWIGAVKDVGFPIFAFWLVWQFMVGSINKLTEAVTQNTMAVTRLVCVVAPDKCDGQIKGGSK